MSGALDHSPARVVRQLLEDLSIGTDPADAGSWPVFATREPGDPDNCITVLDSGVTLEGSHMQDGLVCDRFGVQVRVRSGSDDTGYAKANDAAQALDKSVRLTSTNVGSATYLVYNASRMNGPLALGAEPESRGRVVFALNYDVALRQTA